MKNPVYVLVSILLIQTYPVLAVDSERLIRRANRYFEPLPSTMPGAEHDTREKIALGKKLFFDSRLSINNAQSCASCHPLDAGMAGVDNLLTSPGSQGQTGTRNTPTVLNAGLQRLQFWDGRANDLVEQAREPILDPNEMAMPDEASVERKLRAIVEYQNAFNKAFPNSQPAITYQNITEAIAAFERTLLTPGRFDDFLNGDASALSETEQQGLKTFVKANCKSCHDGALLGGVAMEKLGEKHPYENQSDQGLYDITGNDNDRMVFKVPQLRNIALTAPYFHDGKVPTLEQAIRLMGKLQLDLELKEDEIKNIVAFLNSLTDEQRVK